MQKIGKKKDEITASKQMVDPTKKLKDFTFDTGSSGKNCSDITWSQSLRRAIPDKLADRINKTKSEKISYALIILV